MIYLDYASNTPVDREVLDYYYDISIKYYANPNSSHKLGREAKKVIDDSTNNIKKLLNVDGDIIYTSGSSESNNLAIKGYALANKNKGKHIIISSLEHSSIISSCSSLINEGFDIDIVNVNKDGLIDIDELKNMIRDDTILVSITSIDSELCIKQPIEDIGKLLKNYPNIAFHTDATGAVGRINMDFKNVDLVTFSPHKFYGINGVGILIKNKNIKLKPIIDGGRSTTIYRSGTPVTPLIASVSKSLSIALKNMDERYNYVLKLNNIIINHLKKYNFIHINSTKNSIPYIVNFSIKGIESSKILKLLDDNDIYISSKTSCLLEKSPSKIVYEVTKDEEISKESLRVSLSYLTKEEEIYKFLNILDKIIKENL